MKYILKYNEQWNYVSIRRFLFFWRIIPLKHTVFSFIKTHGKVSISNKREDDAILFNIIRNYSDEHSVIYYNTTHDELYFCKEGLRKYFGEVPKALYIKILS